MADPLSTPAPGVPETPEGGALPAPIVPPPRLAAARDGAHHGRFRLGYGSLLAVLAVVGVGTFFAIDRAPSHRAGAAAGGGGGWSAFAPSQSGELGAIEIAEHVAPHYRAADGKQLVNVVASRNTLQDGQLGFLRVLYQVIQPEDAASRGDSQIVQVTDAIQYSLCGTGTTCAIPGAKTAARFDLVRREGLELALYTFRYDPAVDNVSVFLRPSAAPAPFEGYVLVFRRDVLERLAPELLSRPLEQSLPGAEQQLGPSQLTTAGIDQIERWTSPFLYLYQYQLLGGRDALLQLDPVQG